MSGWDIDPENFQGGLQSVGEAAEEFEDWSESYGDNLSSAGLSAGTLHFGEGAGPVPEEEAGGLVAHALGEFAEATQSDLNAIVSRAGNAMTGATAAFMAYMNGDQEMAEEWQQQTLDISDDIDAGDIPDPEENPDERVEYLEELEEELEQQQ